MLTSEDRSAIATLNADYAGLLDQRRFEQVAALFCPDGRLNRADGTTATGRESILAAQSARPEWLDTVHHVGSPMIEAAGDEEASGRVAFVAVSVDRREGAASPQWSIGHFADRYRREDGAWRIAERSIHVADRR